jgi:EAL domain-containing protein (putative c-di-GMP-specific phosphodiesterase class I)
VAQKILRSFDEPFLIEGNEIYFSACIGIATYPECGDSAGDLLTNSSTAMQSAKIKGAGEVQFFTDSLNENYLDKISTESGLRDALATKSMPDASDILDGLEQGQLQTRYTYKILKEGCRQFVDWQASCPSRGDLTLVIPFPGFHLIDTDFIGSLNSALTSSGIKPQHLVLEIAETKADFKLREFLPLADEIAALGVNLSLNLFALPRTPLTHLFQLNLNTIQIDIRAMDSISDNPKNAIFFKSIVGMAHDLGIEVIADGIATQKEAALTTSLGVDNLMGELFRAAVDLDHIDHPQQRSSQSSTNR